jgi:hypothetical protein
MIRISLGSDCSVAYNLQRLGYRNFSFPFDWIISKNIIDVLSNDFVDFLNVDFLKIAGRTSFSHIEENFSETDEHLCSMLRVKHTKYIGVEFLHDFKNFAPGKEFLECKVKEVIEDIEYVVEKYNRRIERFYNVMRDRNIEKHLYRICKYDEREQIEKIFKEKNFLNWKLHIKLYSEFPQCEEWKRSEFDWDNFFNIF